MSVIGHVGGFLGWLRLHVGSVLAVGSVAAGSLLAAAVGPPAALASANLNWGTGIKAPLPGDAGTNKDVEMHWVSCASAGNCAAVGRYKDALDNRLGLLVTEKLGTWTAVRATLPAGADSDPNPLLNSVSCASTGNCSAVGSYGDTSGNTQGVLLTETSGHWAAGVKATLPSPAANPQVNINSVSCTSPGNCTAVGDYSDSSGNQQGLLLTQTSDSWTAAAATLPAGAATNPGVILGSVSCVSTGNCTAVGEYSDGSGSQGLLLTESSRTWTAAKAKLPNGAGTAAVLNSVSCASAGDCSAVGYYQDNSGHYQGLLLTETSGAPGTGVTAPLPAGAATTTDPSASVASVSCATAGNCTAVGQYNDTSGNAQGVALTETSGHWTAGVKAILPVGAAANPAVRMSSVSCPSVSDCAAIGTYADGSGTQALLLTQTAGAWASGVKAALPADAAADPEVSMTNVSCTSVSNCTADGRYGNGTAYVGLLLGASNGSPRLSVKAPSSGTVGKAIAGSAVSATLSSGAGPIGTIGFRVFGPLPSAPSSCLAGGRVVGGARSVSGNRPYHPSVSFTPTAIGTYWWYASYGGDPGDNAAASACGAAMAKTVVTPTPVVSGFEQTHPRWREGTAFPTIASARKAPVGTTFSFSVSEKVTAKLVFEQGNKVKGALSMAARAGKDKIRFQGRLSRKRRLAPGHYNVVITATNANLATSLPKTLSFTIVR